MYEFFVQNTTNQTRVFDLEIALPLPPGVTASFEQFVSRVALPEVAIPAGSTISRPLFMSGPLGGGLVRVNVFEQVAIPQLPLQGSIVFNGDPTTPGITNTQYADPGITNPGITNPGITNPGITNPGITNVELSNPGITNPGITNPGITNTSPDAAVLVNPGITNPGITNPGITNPSITNPGITNPGITNITLANGSITDLTTTIRNDGNTAAAYAIKLRQNSPPPEGMRF